MNQTFYVEEKHPSRAVVQMLKVESPQYLSFVTPRDDEAPDNRAETALPAIEEKLVTTGTMERSSEVARELQALRWTIVVLTAVAGLWLLLS